MEKWRHAFRKWAGGSFYIRKSYVRAAVALLFLVSLGLFVNAYQQTKPKNIEITTPESSSLEVWSVRLASPRKIRILFNDSVDLHLLTHNFAISPDVVGKIVKGGSDKEFYYESSRNFPESTTLSVLIKEGLVSKNHKTLVSDYTRSVSTEVANDQVQFVKNEIFSKVLTYSAKKPIELDVRSGVGVRKSVVSIYRSSQADLLNYLLYKTQDVKYSTYTNTETKFIKRFRETDQSQKVLSFIQEETNFKKKVTLSPGIYYLEAVKGELPVGSAILLVNNTGIIYRQDDKKVVLSAFALDSGKSVSSPVNAGLYNLQDAPNLLTRQEFTSLGTIPMPFESRVDVVLASVGDETVFVPVKLPESLADIRVNSDLDRDAQIFLYTDRPIYKPGDTVFFRGIVRYDNDASYRVASNTPVRVRLDFGEKGKIDETVQTNAAGVFSGHFLAVKEMKWTQYLSATANYTGKDDYYNTGTAYFDVVEYKKPSYELTLTKENEEYQWHDGVPVTVKGTYFNGKPLSDKEVSYIVYAQNYYEVEKKSYNRNFNITSQGGMCGGGGGGFYEYYGEEVARGSVKLNSSGEGALTFQANKTKLPPTSQKITIIASEVDKQSGNPISSGVNFIVHSSSIVTFFMPSATSYLPEEEVIVPFYAESLTPGQDSPSELSYRFVESSYNSDNNKANEKQILAGKATLDSDGKGIIRFTIPKNMKPNTGGYVILEGKDPQGNKIENKKSLTVTDTKVKPASVYWEGSQTQTYLNITTSSNSYITGEKIQLSIQSPQELDVLFSPERGRIYEARVLHLNKGENTVFLPVTEELSPSITLTFNFFVGGNYYSEGVSLNVPAMHRLLNVGISLDKKEYKPKDTAVLTVTTKDNEGHAVPAQFSLSVVDEAIYALRKNATPPIHSSMYYFRNRSTNASSSLTLVGQCCGGRGGGGGGGNIGGKTVDTLFWDGDLATGIDGERVVPVQLGSVETVWRAQVIASDLLTNVGQNDIRINVRK